MMDIFLALLGFAKTEPQVKYPPVVGWIVLALGGYGAAWVVEGLSRLMPVASVYFRTVGVVAVALLAQSAFRAVFFRDSLSWSGWLRAIVTSGK